MKKPNAKRKASQKVRSKVALLIPCYNESQTIGKVIDDFRRIFPQISIYVCDNNSSDDTFDIAFRHGAHVLKESRRGKGNAVRTLFRSGKADIYVLVDGDDTYPAERLVDLIKPITENRADMVVGDRLSSGHYAAENKRKFHNFGNKLVRMLINMLYKQKCRDIMSGYRAFSQTFVENFPLLSHGFSVETEMTLFALDRNFIIHEIPVEYRDRPTGSQSKLNTVRDGAKVLLTILQLFKDNKPLTFFSLISAFCFILTLISGLPVISEFLKTGQILRIPSAILATGFALIAIQSLFSGFILDTINRNRRELYELWLNKFANQK
jgi:glycosyltransferase involved in cell wall biosynthesis